MNNRLINIGGIAIGGDAPVVIQTMWKERLTPADLEGEAGTAVRERIENLSRMGCGLLRFAVPDIAAAEALGRLSQRVSMPLVADIHFDYKIALRCLDFPIAKIRINPGNIGGKEKVRQVLEKAGEKGVPIRIGVNAGSLPADLRNKFTPNILTQRRQGAENAEGKSESLSFFATSASLRLCENSSPAESLSSLALSAFPATLRDDYLINSTAEALVEAAERELAVCAESGFTDVIVSMKASNITDTVLANRIFAGRNNAPMHIGVTEAGPLVAGVARSSAALCLLLAEGIGDTIRVSLSDSMENEVIAAREICGAAAEIALLNGNEKAAGRLRKSGVKIISCPRCGRHSFDTHGFLARFLPILYSLDRNITVAIMGCEVNGPEEARHADIGITGAGNKALIFRRGVIVRTVSVTDAERAFAEELEIS